MTKKMDLETVAYLDTKKLVEASENEKVKQNEIKLIVLALIEKNGVSTSLP